MIKRIAFGGVTVIGSLVVLVIGYLGLSIWRAGHGLPQWDGQVEVAGLVAPVEVIREEHGVPYVRASNEHDLYFAQGFVHAQDRFWQMSLARRASAGRLAEWLGAIALRSDRRNGHSGSASPPSGRGPASPRRNGRCFRPMPTA